MPCSHLFIRGTMAAIQQSVRAPVHPFDTAHTAPEGLIPRSWRDERSFPPFTDRCSLNLSSLIRHLYRVTRGSTRPLSLPTGHCAPRSSPVGRHSLRSRRPTHLLTAPAVAVRYPRFLTTFGISLFLIHRFTRNMPSAGLQLHLPADALLFENVLLDELVENLLDLFDVHPDKLGNLKR